MQVRFALSAVMAISNWGLGVWDLSCGVSGACI